MAISDALASERSYDDDGEDPGYSGGSASYDEDEDEDGGWAINKDHSDSLWDSAEESSDDDDETPDLVEATDEEEDTDLFEDTAPRRRGRRPGSPSLLANGLPPVPPALTPATSAPKAAAVPVKQFAAAPTPGKSASAKGKPAKAGTKAVAKAVKAAPRATKKVAGKSARKAPPKAVRKAVKKQTPKRKPARQKATSRKAKPAAKTKARLKK